MVSLLICPNRYFTRTFQSICFCLFFISVFVQFFHDWKSQVSLSLEKNIKFCWDKNPVWANVVVLLLNFCMVDSCSIYCNWVNSLVFPRQPTEQRLLLSHSADMRICTRGVICVSTCVMGRHACRGFWCYTSRLRGKTFTAAIGFATLLYAYNPPLGCFSTPPWCGSGHLYLW